MTLPILELTVEQRREIFNQVSIEQNIPVQAVEKDWWVSVTLRAIFASPHAPHLLFKGGTSLSWRLPQNFSFHHTPYENILPTSIASCMLPIAAR